MGQVLGRLWEFLSRRVDSFLLGVALTIAGVGLITLFSAADQSLARVWSQVWSLGFALLRPVTYDAAAFQFTAF